MKHVMEEKKRKGQDIFRRCIKEKAQEQVVVMKGKEKDERKLVKEGKEE